MSVYPCVVIFEDCFNVVLFALFSLIVSVPSISIPIVMSAVVFLYFVKHVKRPVMSSADNVVANVLICISLPSLSYTRKLGSHCCSMFR